MTKYKTINLILFIALIGLVKYWQTVLPYFNLRRVQETHLFFYGWIVGAVLGIGAIAAGIAWGRAYRAKRVRPAEVVLPALVAVAAVWVSAVLFQEWHVLLRIR